ncbi:MAG TPA: hypothetical protein VMD78_09820 [Candidatus Baltobacteraceae bacterium]|nr:hypothetical protein [Candidatus Baltobacteraceae bacterium]
MHMWNDFFVAAAGGSAALAGLVFVALSVNIRNIIQSPHLPPRAAAAIGTLILILVCSMAALMPQPERALGIEVIVFSLYACWLQIVSAHHGFRARVELQRPRWESILNAVLGQVQVLPFVIGGVLLLMQTSSGLYWIAAGCMATFVFSVLNAWVLLVEILR